MNWKPIQRNFHTASLGLVGMFVVVLGPLFFAIGEERPGYVVGWEILLTGIMVIFPIAILGFICGVIYERNRNI